MNLCYRGGMFLIFFAATLSIALGEPPVDRNKLPIQIKSDELLTDNTAKTATFVGKVVAKQGDVTIYSNKLVVHYTNGQDVDQVEAFGHVRIVQENRLGESEYAIYESESGKVTLKDNPKVVQGQDVVTGNVITYFVDEQKSLVTSAPGQRVVSTIHPKEKNQKEKSSKGKDPKEKTPKEKGKNDAKP